MVAPAKLINKPGVPRDPGSEENPKLSDSVDGESEGKSSRMRINC